MPYILPTNSVIRNGIEYTAVQSARGFCVSSLALLSDAFRYLLNPAFADLGLDPQTGKRRAYVGDCTIDGCGVAFAVSADVPEADFPYGLVALMPLELFEMHGKIDDIAGRVPPERLYTGSGVAYMGIESIENLPKIAICLPDGARFEFRAAED